MAPSPYFLLCRYILLISMCLQKMMNIHRYVFKILGKNQHRGQRHRRTDNVKTVYPHSTNKVCRGNNNCQTEALTPLTTYVITIMTNLFLAVISFSEILLKEQQFYEIQNIHLGHQIHNFAIVWAVCLLKNQASETHWIFRHFHYTYIL